MLSSGCLFTKYVEVNPLFPILERPVRPVLEGVSGEEMAPIDQAAKRKIVDNFQKLLTYSEKLEVSVDKYNDFATEKNENSGFNE
jgi:hypothetical protein